MHRLVILKGLLAVFALACNLGGPKKIYDVDPVEGWKCTPHMWWAEKYLIPDDVTIMDSPPRGAEVAIDLALEGFSFEIGPFEHPEVNHYWTLDDIVYAGKASVTGLHTRCHILMEWGEDSTFHESALVEELGHFVHQYALGDSDGGHKDSYWWGEVVPRVDFYLKKEGF